jgi:hypothetical protein
MGGRAGQTGHLVDRVFENQDVDRLAELPRVKVSEAETIA